MAVAVMAVAVMAVAVMAVAVMAAGGMAADTGAVHGTVSVILQPALGMVADAMAGILVASIILADI